MKYILGIDFGHGETSASFIKLTDNILEEDNVTINPEPAHIRKDITHPEMRKIPSVIFKDKNGNYGLKIPNSGICLSFKRKINTNADPDQYKAFESFVREVFAKIISNHPEFSEEGSQLSIYIASPTKWDDIDKAQYKSFVNNAIGENFVVEWVINESDAAFFSKRNNGISLVVDYGSSTIDYTLMVDNKKVDIDTLSNDYGASFIENILLNEYKKSDDYVKKIEKANYELSRTGNPHIDIDSFLLYYLREAKESAYSREDPYLSLNRNIKSFADDCESIDFIFQFGKFDRLLSDYKTMVVRDFRLLQERIAKLLNGRKIENIILSGGASIMPWVAENLHAIFGCNVLIDSNPSCVVSGGIVKYAVAQERAKQKIKDYLCKIDFFKLYSQCDSDVTNKCISELILPVLKQYEDSSDDLPAIDLLNSVYSFFTNLTNDNQYVHLFNSEINKKLNAELNTIIQDVMLNVFEYSFNEAVSIGIIDVPIISFAPTMKGIIEGWITETANVFFYFNMQKPRSKYERIKLTKGVFQYATTIGLDYFPTDNSSDDIPSAISELLRDQVIDNALKIFNEKQLFRTI